MAEISVIIPAYNAAKSIGDTLRSLLCQTYEDLEIIVVDDGSEDETFNIAEQWSRIDCRIRVMHQKNAGAYAARRFALRTITSNFFAFVDADDVVEPTLYSELHEFAIANDLDVAQCNVPKVKDNGPCAEIFNGNDRIKQHIIIPYLIDGSFACVVWDKLYRVRPGQSELIPSQIMMYDDLKMNFQLFQNVQRYGVLYRVLYHHRINEGSSVKNYRRKNLDDLREINAYRREASLVYGIDSNAECHDLWLLKNLRNNIVSACVAKCENFIIRIENVRQLLSMPELTECLNRRRRTLKAIVFSFRLIQRLPIPALIFAVRILKSFKGLFRIIESRRR